MPSIWGKNWCQISGDQYGSAWGVNFWTFETFADANGRTTLVFPECDTTDDDTDIGK